jgi:hypothetical protein
MRPPSFVWSCQAPPWLEITSDTHFAKPVFTFLPKDHYLQTKYFGSRDLVEVKLNKCSLALLREASLQLHLQLIFWEEILGELKRGLEISQKFC